MLLKKGTRVVVSEAYVRQFPRLIGKQGTVTGYPRKITDKCVCVRLDGRACPITISTAFLDVVTQ